MVTALAPRSNCGIRHTPWTPRPWKSERRTHEKVGTGVDLGHGERNNTKVRVEVRRERCNIERASIGAGVEQVDPGERVCVARYLGGVPASYEFLVFDTPMSCLHYLRTYQVTEASSPTTHSVDASGVMTAGMYSSRDAGAVRVFEKLAARREIKVYVRIA